MSVATGTIVKRIVFLATLAGLGSAIAVLLVACGGASTQPRGVSVPAWRSLPAAPISIDQNRTSVWTGRQLILFGRRSVTALDSRGVSYVVKSHDAAEAYDPASR